MSNRRMQDSDYIYEADDDFIGLTSAFPAVKGPQSVEYDEGDEAIGLTGAFAPVVIEEDERSWNEKDKWENFDWNSYESASEDGGSAIGEKQVEADSPSDSAPEPGSEPAPEPDSAPEPADKDEKAAEPKHTDKSADQPADKPAAAAKPATSGSKSGRGRHAAPDASMSPRMQKARTTRRTLVLLIILIILIIICVGVYSSILFNNSQEEAHHAEQEQVETPKDSLASQPADDADDSTAKLTEVPKLTSLMGMTSDEAVKAIGHGAMALPARAVDEEGNPVKSSVNVSLNDEPIDSKTGAPMVYLGLDKDGKVIQVGYSASASALGFGSLSFADAVNNDHVIEKTFSEIGITVPEGSVALPADKKEYSTYASDGKTVTRERCSFEGEVEVNGVPCVWSAVLSYDYTTQMVTGNLSDTVRVIYVYVTQK